MLSQMSLESARVLAQEFERRGFRIAPDEGTPIAELVEVGRPIENGEEQTDVDGAVSSLGLTTVTDSVDGVTTHDDTMALTVTKITELMNRRIDLARNVISPLVKQYSDLIVAKLSEAVPQAPEVVEVNFRCCGGR